MREEIEIIKERLKDMANEMRKYNLYLIWGPNNWEKAESLVTWCEELIHWKGRWCWKDWRQEEKGMTENEMAGWHHGLDGRESEWTPGNGDGQGGLACCDSWGHKESDTTERLNWTELNAYFHIRQHLNWDRGHFHHFRKFQITFTEYDS